MDLNEGKDMEKKLAEEFFSSLKRNSGRDEIKDNYNSYYGYVRNVNALGKGYDAELFEKVSKVYTSWKNGNNP